jgi:ketosteroid isomerase-like protein
MLPPARSLKLRAAALGVAALLASGAAACGEEEDPRSDREQARAVVEELYASIRAKDPEGVCSTMTEPAQQQVAAGAIGTGKSGTCADAFQRFLDAAARQGGLNLTLKAKVERVKITGDTAVATIRFGKARTGEIPLVKQDDEWKLDRAGPSPSQ